MTKSQFDQFAEGRILKLLSKSDFLAVKLFVIMRGSGLNAVVFGRVGLDDYLAVILSAAGTAGHLS